MIFAASMSAYTKRAIGDKALQTNITKIIETLPIDPEISTMDAVVLGPKDLVGKNGAAVLEAIKTKHENVGVIYLYSKDKDKALIEGDVHYKRTPKVTADSVNQAISEVIELKQVGVYEKAFESGDKVNGGAFPGVKYQHQSLADSYMEQAASVQETSVAVMESPEIPAPEAPLLSQEELSAILATEQEQLPEVIVTEETKESSLVGRLKEMNEYPDWEFFQHAIGKDSLVRELVLENTQYAGVVTMLDVLDKQITNTFSDPSLDKDAKFAKIKEIGLDRAGYRGVQDSMIADRVITIMELIVRSAELSVDHRIENIRKSMDKLATVQTVYKDQDKIRTLINERLDLQLELSELARNIIETYKAMDSTVTDLIESMDKELPSSNPYIEHMLQPVKYMFTPASTVKVANKLMVDLQTNRVSMAALEAKVSEVIKMVFKLCEIDNTIIEFQQRQIELLKSQRVEDVIVLTNAIKNCMRLFVAPSESGRTATALTWSGVLSRRNNTVLIDLSGTSKYKEYGVEPITLNEFLTDRIERPFVCVEGNIDHDLEGLSDIIQELTTRVNYYGFINIILSDKQVELMNKLAEHAVSVHFITNCTKKSMQDLKQTMKSLNYPNIAQKVILIDPPVDASYMLNDLDIDPLMIKLIILPRLQHIAAASLKGFKPYESSEVVEVFEEAFR